MPPAVAQLPAALLRSVPWAHHQVLLEKIKDLPTRLWYMRAIQENGWSRNVLLMQFQTEIHLRQGKAANAVEVFHLDARNPTSMVLADRFRLNPRDIVYVDAGTLVRFSRVMELLLPTVSAVTSAAVAEANVTYLRRAY